MLSALENVAIRHKAPGCDKNRGALCNDIEYPGFVAGHDHKIDRMVCMREYFRSRKRLGNRARSDGRCGKDERERNSMHGDDAMLTQR